jgi:hypothetical protein
MPRKKKKRKKSRGMTEMKWTKKTENTKDGEEKMICIHVFKIKK